MMRHDVKLIRYFLQRACWAWLVPCSLCLQVGCTMVDGNTLYRCCGRLLWADSSQPANGLLVVVAGRPITAEQASSLLDTRSQTLTTDAGGRYAVGFPGVGWGYYLLLGFIPVGQETPPVPPPLQCVYVYYALKGTWKGQRVSLPDGSQTSAKPGERYLEIPDILVSRGPS